jgi:hypothetical protein
MPRLSLVALGPHHNSVTRKDRKFISIGIRDRVAQDLFPLQDSPCWKSICGLLRSGTTRKSCAASTACLTFGMPWSIFCLPSLVRLGTRRPRGADSFPTTDVRMVGQVLGVSMSETGGSSYSFLAYAPGEQGVGATGKGVSYDATSILWGEKPR